MGTTVKKLSVSIEETEYKWAKSHAKATGQSLSGVLTLALREQRRLAAMDRLLRKLGADKISDEKMAKIRAEIYAK